jgi:hypothetical protein
MLLEGLLLPLVMVLVVVVGGALLEELLQKALGDLEALEDEQFS